MHQPDGSQPSSVQDQFPQSLVQGVLAMDSHAVQPHSCTTWPRTWGLSPRLVVRVPLPDQEDTRLIGTIPGKCLVRSKA